MLSDILRFNKEAYKYLDAPEDFTLGECLDALKMGDWFRRYYLLPMGGSIWSCPVDQMLQFPAASLLRFFHNHGLLTVKDHPQWYTVKGGSREYVRRILARMPGDFKIRSGATQIERNPSGGSVLVMDAEGRTHEFDEVIVAAHPDQALNLLQHPTADEQRLLSAFRYQPNEVVLHTDTAFMPKRRSAWASWVYRSEGRIDKSPAVSLSYWMNNLQDLETDVPVIVTLNPSREPRKETVINRHWFDHPVFDEKAIAAQKDFMRIQGTHRIWYCGAYQRNGFHEDGLWSAVRVVKEMGVESEWQENQTYCLPV
jgi:predicted NAD/FAD-binding protein